MSEYSSAAGNPQRSLGGAVPGPRPPHQYENVCNNIACRTDMLGDLLRSLELALNPILEPELNTTEAAQAPPPRAVECELIRTLNDRSDALSRVSDRLESIINRIRL